MSVNQQPRGSRPGQLEEELRGVLRKLHYSRRTEETYVGWYRQFVLWNGKRHPNEMGAAEVTAFLTHLAVNRKVSAETWKRRVFPCLRTQTGRRGWAGVALAAAAVGMVVAFVGTSGMGMGWVTARVTMVAATIRMFAATIRMFAATIRMFVATIGMFAATIAIVAATIAMVAAEIVTQEVPFKKKNMPAGTGVSP